MCGINGFNFLDKNKIQKMMTLTENRGPDAKGIFESENMTLGHNRLSIIDLSTAANQPLTDDNLTIIFIGDAAVEEDYVLASLSWAAKKELPILFVVEDNNYAVLTKKEDRRDWKAKDVAKAFKLDSYDTQDNPEKIFKILKKNIFKKPIFINVHTKRLYWHAGAGEDEKVFGDRLGKEMKYLGKRAVEIDNKIKNRIKKLWQQRLEKL